MKLFDLHCDTATVLAARGETFASASLHLFEKTLPLSVALTQCFAVFFNDVRLSSESVETVRRVRDSVFPTLPSRVTPLLTVEGAGVLADGGERWISDLADLGCRVAGLCWNGENRLATGAVRDDTARLSAYGRDCVSELIRHGHRAKNLLSKRRAVFRDGIKCRMRRKGAEYGVVRDRGSSPVVRGGKADGYFRRQLERSREADCRKLGADRFRYGGPCGGSFVGWKFE